MLDWVVKSSIEIVTKSQTISNYLYNLLTGQPMVITTPTNPNRLIRGLIFLTMLLIALIFMYVLKNKS